MAMDETGTKGWGGGRIGQLEGGKETGNMRNGVMEGEGGGIR
jgi:hypothetical protein